MAACFCAPAEAAQPPDPQQSLVAARNYLLSTLPVPLAETGSFVFPVNTAKFVLEQEGFYEGEQTSR